MPKSAFGVDLAMNCATTNAYILKLMPMHLAGNRTYRSVQVIIDFTIKHVWLLFG